MNFEDESEKTTPQYYYAKTEQELKSKWFFDNLISDYYRIYQTYKVKGRLEDANSVYVELNDLYGKRLRVIFYQDQTLRNFLKWKRG